MACAVQTTHAEFCLSVFNSETVQTDSCDILILTCLSSFPEAGKIELQKNEFFRLQPYRIL